MWLALVLIVQIHEWNAWTKKSDSTTRCSCRFCFVRLKSDFSLHLANWALHCGAVIDLFFVILSLFSLSHGAYVNGSGCSNWNQHPIWMFIYVHCFSVLNDSLAGGKHSNPIDHVSSKCRLVFFTFFIVIAHRSLWREHKSCYRFKLRQNKRQIKQWIGNKRTHFVG